MGLRGICCGLVLALCAALASCGDSGAKLEKAETPPYSLSVFEQAALLSHDKSDLTVSFGEAGLGDTYFEAPNSAGVGLQDNAEDSKVSSRFHSGKYCWKHHKRYCHTCEPQDCLKVIGVCSKSERLVKVADCCAKTADVIYVAQVQFDGDSGKKSEVEVTFVRDGNEVGRADTDVTGKATFLERNVPRGPHKIYVQVAEGCTGNCQPSPCIPELNVTFTKTAVTVTSSKDLSNVVLKYCNGCVQKYDGLCGRSGTFLGYGSYAGRTIAGAWVKSGCNSSGDGPGYGKWFANPFSDCRKCGCEGNACDACSSILQGGAYMSGMDFAVYTDCIQGAVTGTGYIPSCDPLRVGLRDGFSFRIAYDNGAAQGRMNYSGGKYAGAWKVTDAAVKWLVIADNESWFGGDNWMVHAVDNGPTFTDDFFEIWINDPVSCTCYHCGGKLVGCYVHVSYRYSSSCP